MTSYIKCDRCGAEFPETDFHYILNSEGTGYPDLSCPLHFCNNCGQKLKEFMEKN